MLATAAGRAFLAACSPGKRKIVLDFLAHSSNPLDQAARNPRLVSRILRDNIRDDYAIRVGEVPEHTTSLAVPLRVDGEGSGAITVSYLNSALTLDKAEALLLPPLRRTAEEIERQFAGAMAVFSGLPVR